MQWTIYAVAAAVFLAIADIMVKLAAGRLPNSLGMLLYGCIPFTTGLVWFFIDRMKSGPVKVESKTYLYALGVGVAFSLVTFAMYSAFKGGAPISVASPLIRLGGLVLASIVGLVFWNEPITGRYLLGLFLSLLGVYLIVTR